MPTQLKNRRGEPEWYAVLKVNGKRLHKKCPDKDAALLLEINHRREMALYNLTPQVVTLAGLLVNYVQAVESRGISNASVTEKTTVFAEFGKALGPHRDVRSITYGEVERHLAGVAQRVSGDRANRHRVHIVAAYDWGIKAMRLASPNPWQVEKFKADKQARYVPTVEDFWAVFEAAAEEEDQQTQRLLLTYLHTSARKTEVFTMKWADVDLHARKLRLWTRKRNGGLESDLVPMTQLLEGILRDQKAYLEKQTREQSLAEATVVPFPEYVFVNPATRTRYAEHGKLMRRLCARAKVTPFGFHAIRHLSASILADARIPLPVIQGMLRHQNSTVTSKYLHALMGVHGKLDGVFDRQSKKATSR